MLTRLGIVALVATQLPLLAVASLALTTDDLSETTVLGLVFLATAGGTAVLLLTLRDRLRPLEVASRRLRRFLHLGILDIGGPYPDDELGRLLAELDEVCLRLDDARIEAVRAASFDHVTGALTRRAADDRLGELARQVRRRDDHLTVALLDIDHFKQVNDRLGHAAGDAALRHTVDVLGRSLRGVVLIGRWGGDELILAVRGRSDEVTAGLDRARKAVSERLGRVLGTSVTVSAGVAELRPADTIAECIAVADGALYAAKANGRDRVVDASAGVLQLW
jgi:diguanylate cyclase (GGDEF)-like protein